MLDGETRAEMFRLKHTDEPKLKPCPFCGCDASYYKDSLCGDNESYYVSCVTNTCATIRSTRNHFTKEAILIMWNKRVPQK